MTQHQLFDTRLDSVRLVLIRGLPGSNKSELARSIAQECGFLHIENDMFFTDKNGVYRYDHRRVHQSQEWCFSRTASALLHGRKVVVANVFSKHWHMQSYVDLAPDDHLIIECSGTGLVRHNIPTAVVRRMASAFEPHPEALISN